MSDCKQKISSIKTACKLFNDPDRAGGPRPVVGRRSSARTWGGEDRRLTTVSIVVLEPEVGDELLAAQVAEGVLQLHQLDEEIVFGVEAGRGLRALEVKRKPLLYAVHSGALRQVEEQGKVEDERGGEN